MKYAEYVIESLKVFVFCFILGITIDKQFKFIQDNYNVNKVTLAICQLLTIITVTYIIYKYKIFRLFFESYSPHILFSSFLFSLQNTMIDNFKYILNN
jgi:hypothetical protein